MITNIVQLLNTHSLSGAIPTNPQSRRVQNVQRTLLHVGFDNGFVLNWCEEHELCCNTQRSIAKLPNQRCHTLSVHTPIR